MKIKVILRGKVTVIWRKNKLF